MTVSFQFETTPLPGMVVMKGNPRRDARGEFERLFCVSELRDFGIEFQVNQINRSLSRSAGTVRGLHFQYPPHAEGKLITCLSGRVFDVAADLRRNSPTFGQWFAVELGQGSHVSVFLPPGIAHGFQTLTPDCELIYLHSQAYHPQSEGGIHHRDPRLAIQWPLAISQVSDRDAALPNIDSSFEGIDL
ncbi:MAG: dTDP-4-dehydrorhamnose 3,5-epimerase family protein [Hyphomicrobiaceae bacterium]|nr:dTDP-4-dehydrorhamnose 3,5-epimerase family protein [Hyphomicrobiaceae bacterium]